MGTYNRKWPKHDRIIIIQLEIAKHKQTILVSPQKRSEDGRINVRSSWKYDLYHAWSFISMIRCPPSSDVSVLFHDVLGPVSFNTCLSCTIATFEAVYAACPIPDVVVLLVFPLMPTGRFHVLHLIYWQSSYSAKTWLSFFHGPLLYSLSQFHNGHLLSFMGPDDNIRSQWGLINFPWKPMLAVQVYYHLPIWSCVEYSIGLMCSCCWPSWFDKVDELQLLFLRFPPFF